MTGAPDSGRYAADWAQTIGLHVVGACALWMAIAAMLRTRRAASLDASEPPAGAAPTPQSTRPDWIAALSRTAWAFAPLWINAVGLWVFRSDNAKEIARSFVAITTGLSLAMAWRLFNYRPLTRFMRDDAEALQASHADARANPSDLSGKPIAHASGMPAKRPWWRLCWSTRVLIVAMAAHAILFTTLSWMKYLSFNASVWDLSIYTQQLWAFTQGKWFYCSVFDALRDNHMMSEHFMPIVLLLAPLYALFPDPRFLLLFQAVTVALAAWPIYQVTLWFTDRQGGNRALALALALSYLLHPLVQHSSLCDYHPESFLPLLMTTAFYALLKERWPLYGVTILLGLMVKEDVSLAVTLLGVYAALVRRCWLVGAVTAAVGLGWFVIALNVVIPHFSGGDYRHTDSYVGFVRPFADGRPESATLGLLLWVVVRHPLYTLDKITTLLHLEGALQFIGPTLAMCALGPAEALVMAPNLASLWLSGDAIKIPIKFYYAFALTPYLYVATASGVTRLARWRGRSQADGRDRDVCVFFAAAIVIVSAGLCLQHGVTPLSSGFQKRKYRQDDKWAVGRAFMKTIPPDAPLSAQQDVGTFLSHRLGLYKFPEIKDATHIVLNLHTLEDVRVIWTFRSKKEYYDTVKQFLDSGEWGLKDMAGGFVLLERGASLHRNSEVLTAMDRYLAKSSDTRGR